MKVVHLSYKDTEEGAAIAVERLCKALINENIDSKMLVQSKVSDYQFVHTIVHSKFEKIKAMFRIGCDQIANILLSKNKNDHYTLFLFGSNLYKNKLIKEADIIHLHWINRGYVSLKTLKWLSKYNKPVIWTLHDSWVFTGGCHMTETCEKYKTGCEYCDQMKLKKLSKRNVIKKKKVFDKLNLNIVAPSIWMKDRAMNSLLLREKNIKVIPNCIDTTIFKPIDKKLVRDILNLPKDKKILLFFMSKNKRKGNSFIDIALSRLDNIYDYEIISFGSSFVYQDIFNDKMIKCFGKVNDGYMLSLLYNAADVYISPALEEPFGQTYIEAMACGTPCVGFDFSGPKDIIDHKESGYLAKYMNEEDLALGIKFCIDNYIALSKNSVKKVNREFSYEVVARRHLDFYNEVIHG